LHIAVNAGNRTRTSNHQVDIMASSELLSSGWFFLSFVAYFLKFARYMVFRPSSLCKFRRLDELNDLLLLLPILPKFVFNAFILSQNLNHKIRRELHFDDMWLIGIVSLAGSLGGLLADEFLIKRSGMVF
jgi:hypothetical protein